MEKKQVYQRKGVCSPKMKNARKRKDVYYIREEKIATGIEMVGAEMAKVCSFKIYSGELVTEYISDSWVHSFLHQILSIQLLWALGIEW